MSYRALGAPCVLLSAENCIATVPKFFWNDRFDLSFDACYGFFSQEPRDGLRSEEGTRTSATFLRIEDFSDGFLSLMLGKQFENVQSYRRFVLMRHKLPVVPLEAKTCRP